MTRTPSLLAWGLLAASAVAAPADLFEERDDGDAVVARQMSNGTSLGSTGTTTGSGTLNCEPDSPDGIQPACYDDLDVEGYINDWLAKYSVEANCEALGFAQCYLQYNSYSGLTCDLITSNTCPPFQTEDASAYDSPQQFYTLWNIYTVYQVFNAFSAALWNGHSLAADTIGSIVEAVSPPTNAEAANTAFGTLFASGLYLFGTSLAFAPAGPAVTLATNMVSQAAIAFGMSNALRSAATADTDARFTALADVGSALADLVQNYQKSLEGGIKELQGNSTLFTTLVKGGSLSGRIDTSSLDTTIDLFKNLQTYILSQALLANGIVIAKSTGVDAMEFIPTTNGALSGCDALSAQGTCYQWFVSENGDTYALHNPNEWRNNYIDVLVQIIDNDWADTKTLYQVEDCAGKTPSLDPTTLAPTCLAVHNWCEWDYASEGANQWTNCDGDKNWGKLCSSWETSYDIPESYMGPWLTQPNAWCKLTDD